MNVRIVPRGAPNRTELYSTERPLLSDGQVIIINGRDYVAVIDLWRVAEILLDDDPGGGF